LAKAALQGLLAALAAHTTYEPRSRPWWTSAQATARLLGVGLNLGQLLQAVLQEHLPAYRFTDTLDNCQHLRFDPEDIYKFVLQTRQERGWLLLSEVASRLGVGKPLVLAWMRQGLLRRTLSAGTASYFDVEAINHFAAHYLLTHQVADRLGLHRTTIHYWVHKGYLSPLSGPPIDGCSRYLFRRADVEAFLRAKRDDRL
jgi:excisionase family DNA binding protein